MPKLPINSWLSVSRWSIAIAFVLSTFFLYQLPAFCFDLTGDWSSEWGNVHLQPAGANADGSLAVRGYWDQKPGQRGVIQSGGYSRATKVLWFDYYQPWNRQTGRASFVLKNSGTLFDGTYRQGNQSGRWALRRSVYQAPVATQRVIPVPTMTKGEIRRARKNNRRGREGCSG